MSLQRPLHSPPKAEHDLFVPDKEQNPSPPRETQSQKPKAIPGYRGFIRGSQHYYGLTDGEVSRLSTREHVPQGVHLAVLLGERLIETSVH